jgi:hypothetical protein
MSAKNVKTLRAAHESWNKRDFAGVINNAAEGLAYTDHGRNTTLNTQRSLESGPKDGPRHSRTAALPFCVSSWSMVLPLLDPEQVAVGGGSRVSGPSPRSHRCGGRCTPCPAVGAAALLLLAPLTLLWTAVGKIAAFQARSLGSQLFLRSGKTSFWAGQFVSPLRRANRSVS